MNISELLRLADWIDQEIHKNGLLTKYQALHATMNRNNQQNQAKVSFETEQKELLAALDSMVLTELSRDQLNFLSQIGIRNDVGKLGVHDLEDLLYKNVIDLATSAKVVNEKYQRLANSKKRVDAVRFALEGIDLHESELEEEGEVLFRVYFQGDASISNVADLKKWSGIWYDIGRGVAMFHHESPQDVRVVGADTGSIVIELGVIAAMALTIGKIIKQGLDIAEQTNRIRIQSETIQSMKLSNKKIASDLNKEADKVKAEGAQTITASVSADASLEQNAQGDVEKALSGAIVKLLDFLDRGGRVDIVIRKDDMDPDDADLQALDEQVNEIRRLEATQRRIESQPVDE